MLGLASGHETTDSRQAVLLRVREIVAEQMAMDPFEVKPHDDLNLDLHIAGEDVLAVLDKIHEEFRTNFLDLVDIFGYYFYGEEAAGEAIFFWLPTICCGTAFAMLGWLRGLFASVGLLVVLYCVYKWRASRRKRLFEPEKLSLTIDDLVDAVMNGEWIQPDDIWERIAKLGDRKV